MLPSPPMSTASEFEAEGQRRQARWAAAGATARWAGLLLVAALGIYLAFFRPAADDRVLDTLRASGLSHPTLGDAKALACTDGESSRHFTATNAQGNPVEGTVCCGTTNGCTIRW